MNGDLNSWEKFCNYLWFDKKIKYLVRHKQN